MRKLLDPGRLSLWSRPARGGEGAGAWLSGGEGGKGRGGAAGHRPLLGLPPSLENEAAPRARGTPIPTRRGRELPTSPRASCSPSSNRCPGVHPPPLPRGWSPRGRGSGAAQMETRTARTVPGCHPQAPSIWSRVPTPATRAHGHAHTGTAPRADPAPAPPRPLREPPPALPAPAARRGAGGGGSGRFDFPAARAPRSRSWSRGGALAAASPAPPPPALDPARGGPLRRPGLHAARARPPPPAPHRPPRPSLACTPSAPAPGCTRPSRRPRPAPLRLALLRPSSLGSSPHPAAPPASLSRPPHPFWVRGPRSLRPLPSLTSHAPSSRSSLSSLPPASAPAPAP